MLACCATKAGSGPTTVALARVGQKPSLHHFDASSCNGCFPEKDQPEGAQASATVQQPCPLVCGPAQWIYVGIFAPLQEHHATASRAFKFRVAVSGRAYTRLLDLPACGFAEVWLWFCVSMGR